MCIQFYFTVKDENGAIIYQPWHKIIFRIAWSSWGFLCESRILVFYELNVRIYNELSSFRLTIRWRNKFYRRFRLVSVMFVDEGRVDAVVLTVMLNWTWTAWHRHRDRRLRLPARSVGRIRIRGQIRVGWSRIATIQHKLRNMRNKGSKRLDLQAPGTSAVQGTSAEK